MSDDHEAAAVQLLRGLGYRVSAPVARLDVAEAARRYEAGEMLEDLARDYGVGRQPLSIALITRGVTIRRACRIKGASPARKDRRPVTPQEDRR